MWFLSVVGGSMALWVFCKIDLRRDEPIRAQIECSLKADIDLFRNCLRYTAGMGMAQVKML